MLIKPALENSGKSKINTAGTAEEQGLQKQRNAILLV